MVHVAYGERGLIVRNLATGAERPVELPAKLSAPAIVQLEWSPDSDALAVTLIVDACVHLEPSRYLTVLVTVSTGAARTLLDNDPRLLMIDAWPEAGQMRLKDWDGGLWWLDLQTGSVTPA